MLSRALHWHRLAPCGDGILELCTVGVRDELYSTNWHTLKACCIMSYDPKVAPSQARPLWLHHLHVRLDHDLPSGSMSLGVVCCA